MGSGLTLNIIDFTLIEVRSDPAILIQYINSYCQEKLYRVLKNSFLEVVHGKNIEVAQILQTAMTISDKI